MGNEKQKLFQYIILILFGAFAIIGVIVLATSPKEGAEKRVAVPLTIWGPPLPGDGATELVRLLKEEGDVLDTTTYVVKNPATLYSDLVKALSVGRGPDAVIIDASMLLTMRELIQPVSYEALPMGKYRERYIEGAELFALDDGVYAFPLVVDPLVLYWNRNLFTNALISQVPDNWVSFVELVPRLTIIEDDTVLTQSAISFGEYDNVLHAKEILSALLMQTGISIVYNNENDRWVTDLVSSHRKERASDPVLALRFFTDFSDPIKKVYSWNKTFERSREAFAANKVAMYGGFASEIETLSAINPNLNFDIAMWPQSTLPGRNKLTYGKFYALAVLKQSTHQNAAFVVASELAGAANAQHWQDVTGLPTARRDMLREVPSDPYSSVIVRSALISRSWHDPDVYGTDETFMHMVNMVNTGQKQAESALLEAGRDVETLLDNYNEN